MADADDSQLHTITVTKLDAARRQLATAVLLWFHDEDPVATFTLAVASHEIIHRLHKPAGTRKLLYSDGVLSEAQRQDLAAYLGTTAGFFKHANRQGQAAEESVELWLFAIRLLLLSSINGIEGLGLNITAAEYACLLWNRLHCREPGLMRHLEAVDGMSPEVLQQLVSIEKAKFLERIEKLVEQRIQLGRPMRGIDPARVPVVAVKRH